MIGWVALVAGRQRPYPIRDGNRHHTGVTGFAAALSAEVARSPGHDLFDLLPTPRSSIGYRYDWTTRLDKIKNLDDGADTRLSRALEQEQSGAFLADPDPPTATPAPQIVWGPAGSPGPVGTRGPAPSPSGDAQDFPVFNSERQIISQASLTVEVEDVGTAITELRAFVESVGGFISHVSTTDGPQPGRGSPTIRVPAEQFNHTIDRIEAFGEVLGQSLGQTDVTGDAIDLAAQLRSERSAEASLLKLLDRAVSVSDVSRVPGSGVRGRGSGERETTASSLAGKQQAREKEDNGGQGKDGPAGAIAQGGNGR